MKLRNLAREYSIIAALLIVIIGGVGVAASSGGIQFMGGIARSGLPAPVAAGAPIPALHDVYGRLQVFLGTALRVKPNKRH